MTLSTEEHQGRHKEKPAQNKSPHDESASFRIPIRVDPNVFEVVFVENVCPSAHIRFHQRGVDREVNRNQRHSSKQTLFAFR